MEETTEEQIPHLGGAFIEWPDQCTMMPNIWQYMIDHYKVESMVDVGCGGGHCAKWFLDKGVDAIGVEGWQEAIDGNKLPRERLVQHDYTLGPLTLDKEVDLAWAAEFVEHVEEKFIDNFAATFQCAKRLLITHAIPGQGGYHHVNEKDMMYWIVAMNHFGFVFQPMETLYLRSLQPVIGLWGVQTLLYFEKGGQVR